MAHSHRGAGNTAAQQWCPGIGIQIQSPQQHNSQSIISHPARLHSNTVMASPWEVESGPLHTLQAYSSHAIIQASGLPDNRKMTFQLNLMTVQTVLHRRGRARVLRGLSELPIPTCTMMGCGVTAPLSSLLTGLICSCNSSF